MKQASNSRLIKDKDREKINDVMDRVDSVMSGTLPDSLQSRIPTLPGNLPVPPGFFPNQSGNQALLPGSFRSLLPARPKSPSSDLKSKP